MLQDYQKKIIEKKLALNFSEELEKSKNEKNRKSFHKIFRSELDILIHQFYLDGIQFYGFSIDVLFISNNDPEKWKYLHTHVEDWVNDLGLEVELIELVYISIELGETNPRLNGILGVRTILGENEVLDIEIKKVFRSYHDHEYINIERLLSIYDIRNYWYFVMKENNLKFHRFARYGEPMNYIDIYGTISDSEMIYDESERYAFGLCIHNNSPTFNIVGIKRKKPEIKTIIIYLISLYFWHHGYRLYKNQIYRKIKNTNCTWEIVYSLESLKKKYIIILEYLKIRYPQQLRENDIMEIINNNWNITLDDIINNNNYFSELDMKYSIIEFKDGIFFLEKNMFVSFEDIKYESVCTRTNFDLKYSDIKSSSFWSGLIRLFKRCIY